MALLGTPYRLFYEAKTFRTGLTDVVAAVLRPDLTVFGVISLQEILTPGFAGIYSGVITTTDTDQPGEWLARVASPTEQIVESTKIALEHSPLPAILLALSTINQTIGMGAALGQVIGMIEAPTTEYVGKIEPSADVTGVIEPDEDE